MSILLAILLASGLQAGVRNDINELRQYLGMTYPSVIQALNAKNQILLRNTEPLAPAHAAEMRLRMQAPDRLAVDHPLVAAIINNVGQGLLSFLFEDDFLTEQVNFVFCPAQGGDPAKTEHVMAIQVLFDDRRALAPAVTLLADRLSNASAAAAGCRLRTCLELPSSSESAREHLEYRDARSGLSAE